MIQPDEPQRYTRTAVLLHWLVALAVIAQIGFGFLLDDLAPRGTPARAPTINLHKSTGIVLAALIAVRLWWRLRHAPPAWPVWVGHRERRAAEWGHRALYACMVAMPLSGYVGSNFSKHGVKFFGIALKPWGPDLPQVYNVLNGTHIVLAYVLTALIAGHVIAALRHALDRRGTAFFRMRT